jgi:cation diffusion facilitator family transporter
MYMLQQIFLKALKGKNPANAKVREKVGTIGGVAGIVVNAIIFIIEIIVGSAVNSVAITADAFHNLTDVVSSGITILTFRLANKPADKEHPFGHGRIEYISALFVAMVVMVIGFEFIKTSIEKIMHPSPVVFNLVSLLLVIAAIPLKLLLSVFNRNLGELIGSSALKATSFDALSDVLVLSVASVSLIMSAFTKIQIDGYIGVVVAIFIMYTGFMIARIELGPLLGEAPDPILVKNINDGVLNADYVSGVHDLIIHNYGPGKFMATIHAEVPCDISILKIHDSIDRAEKYLSKKLGIILVIHMDPINNNDEVVKAAKKVVSVIIKEFVHVISMHDFRVVGEGERKNLIFDVVVDSSVVTESDENMLKAGINEVVKRANPHYNTIINVDKNYISP